MLMAYRKIQLQILSVFLLCINDLQLATLFTDNAIQHTLYLIKILKHQSRQLVTELKKVDFWGIRTIARMDTIPKAPSHPERTQFQMDTISNGYHPEWTPSRMAQSRMDTIPNGHHPEWAQSRMTPSRMDTIPNGHNPECTQSRMDTIPNGHNPKWTQSRMDTIPNGQNPE